MDEALHLPEEINLTFRKNNIPLEIAKNVSPVFQYVKQPAAITNGAFPAESDKPFKIQKTKMPPIFMNQVIKGVEIGKKSFKLKRHTIDTNAMLMPSSLQSVMNTTKNSFQAGNLAEPDNADLLPDIRGDVRSYTKGDNYELGYNGLRRKIDRKRSTMFYKTTNEFGLASVAK